MSSSDCTTGTGIGHFLPYCHIRWGQMWIKHPIRERWPARKVPTYTTGGKGQAGTLGGEMAVPHKLNILNLIRLFLERYEALSCNGIRNLAKATRNKFAVHDNMCLIVNFVLTKLISNLPVRQKALWCRWLSEVVGWVDPVISWRQLTMFPCRCRSCHPPAIQTL